jgi:nucleoside-triphosphatase THEP1
MEAGEHQENILSIGKYKFSKAAFDRASQILFKAINKNSGWIIIDEVGPLELKDVGFSEVIKKLFSISPQLNIVLVVRENLFASVLHYFNIEEYSLFSEL